MDDGKGSAEILICIWLAEDPFWLNCKTRLQLMNDKYHIRKLNRNSQAERITQLLQYLTLYNAVCESKDIIPNALDKGLMY